MNGLLSDHPWSEQSLFDKAKLYVEQMESQSEVGRAGLLAALSLEILARAALSHISPVLLAGDRNWRNLTYALGSQSTRKRFRPSSISSKELYERIHELVAGFTDEDLSFCLQQAERRNIELHTGDLAFEKSSDWRPRFYQACKVLVESMGRQPNDLFTDLKIVKKMISSLKDTAARSVYRDICSHKKLWEEKTDKERQGASLDAEAGATSDKGHRVECPACKSQALVKGDPLGRVETRIMDGEVIEKQGMAPSSFVCTACGLRISGLSRLSACGLGDTFTDTITYTEDEYHSAYWESVDWAGYSVDMNE